MKNPLILLSVLYLLLVHGNAAGLAQPKCETAKDIDYHNKGTLNQIYKIKGKKNAKLFLLLDPSLSAPELKEYIVDKHYIIAMKRLRKSLFSAGIDEVIIWRSKILGGQMGMAVPFKNGCVVSGYGEPDYFEKLKIMYETYLLISKNGFDDPAIKNHIKKILMLSPFQYKYKDAMVDKFIKNIRILSSKY